MCQTGFLQHKVHHQFIHTYLAYTGNHKHNVYNTPPTKTDTQSPSTHTNTEVCNRHTSPKHCVTGPLPKTLVDFWRLVWQERPPSIVMITNLEEGGKIKCQQYWPESGRCQYGPFGVTLTDEEIMTDYTTRKLEAQVS